jgi:hypothetical protein
MCYPIPQQGKIIVPYSSCGSDSQVLSLGGDMVMLHCMTRCNIYLGKRAFNRRTDSGVTRSSGAQGLDEGEGEMESRREY